jgi:outer membrane protein assembly factor BamE (lipoprotein component of BamABCDE complex)
MFIVKRKHFVFIIIIVFNLFANCSLKESKKTHGINFLENRAKTLELNKSNKNDAIKILGNPHISSLYNDNKWIYIERTLTKGKMHKLGQNVLKSNNVLKLEFDKYGVLISKKILDKNDMEKIKFSKKKTENIKKRGSFVNDFLSSVRQKMYSNSKRK